MAKKSIKEFDKEQEKLGGALGALTASTVATVPSTGNWTDVVAIINQNFQILAGASYTNMLPNLADYAKSVNGIGPDIAGNITLPFPDIPQPDQVEGFAALEEIDSEIKINPKWLVEPIRHAVPLKGVTRDPSFDPKNPKTNLGSYFLDKTGTYSNFSPGIVVTGTELQNNIVLAVLTRFLPEGTPQWEKKLIKRVPDEGYPPNSIPWTALGTLTTNPVTGDQPSPVPQWITYVAGSTPQGHNKNQLELDKDIANVPVWATVSGYDASYNNISSPFFLRSEYPNGIMPLYPDGDFPVDLLPAAWAQLGLFGGGTSGTTHNFVIPTPSYNPASDAAATTAPLLYVAKEAWTYTNFKTKTGNSIVVTDANVNGHINFISGRPGDFQLYTIPTLQTLGADPVYIQKINNVTPDSSGNLTITPNPADAGAASLYIGPVGTGPGYLTTYLYNQPNGVPQLNTNGKIPDYMIEFTAGSTITPLEMGGTGENLADHLGILYIDEQDSEGNDATMKVQVGVAPHTYIPTATATEIGGVRARLEGSVLYLYTTRAVV